MRKRSTAAVLSLELAERGQSVNSVHNTTADGAPAALRSSMASSSDDTDSLKSIKHGKMESESSLMKKNRLTWGQTLASLAIRFLIMVSMSVDCVGGKNSRILTLTQPTQALALFFALLIPFFGDLLTLTGAFMVTSSCYYFPLMIYCRYYVSLLLGILSCLSLVCFSYVYVRACSASWTSTAND